MSWNGLRDVGTIDGGRPRPAAPQARKRVVALDVLRGFALCGILLANVKPIAHRGGELGTEQVPETTAAWVLHLLVDQRFFPIFSLLFGVGFSLLLESAQARARQPRVVLLRRLLALLAVGLVHFLVLWKGDILAVYATLGLLVLLPSTWLPRRVVAIAAGVLIVLSVGLLGGWYSVVPGLFLLGSALARYGVLKRIDSGPRTTAVLGLIFALAAVPTTVIQLRAGSPAAAFRIAYPAAGLLTAGAYVCGMLLLLRTRLAGPLTAVFRPLGRMALTNYLTATMLVLAISGVVGDSDRWPVGGVVAVAAAVLLVQWMWSVVWLRRCHQGPVEWLWRWVTWWQRPPLRRPR
ncbi:putative membrane protein YeiB [Micromonospora olivasterospora]|uniref:Putative membrane protein YeiB n=2 Tax=Micromonospora olivasterospora TaxID=1880 RepID=A0A562IK25_MICOL|nr:putative membrane protein YeiB [Micromonospora olivasterospora]